MQWLHYVIGSDHPILVIMNLMVSDLTIGSQNALWYSLYGTVPHSIFFVNLDRMT